MPYRAPGPDDPRQAWILREIQTAQNTLDEAILKAQALPATDTTKSQRLSRYRELRRTVDKSFDSLIDSTKVWADDDLSSYYKEGFFIAGAEVGGELGFTLPHREALELISLDGYTDVATRLQSVKEGFGEVIELQALRTSQPFKPSHARR